MHTVTRGHKPYSRNGKVGEKGEGGNYREVFVSLVTDGQIENGIVGLLGHGAKDPIAIDSRRMYDRGVFRRRRDGAPRDPCIDITGADEDISAATFDFLHHSNNVHASSVEIIAYSSCKRDYHLLLIEQISFNWKRTIGIYGYSISNAIYKNMHGYDCRCSLWKEIPVLLSPLTKPDNSLQ